MRPSGRPIRGSCLKMPLRSCRTIFSTRFRKGQEKIGSAAGQAVADPLEFLKRPIDMDEMGKVYGASRNMWSTASILDAAGLKMYRNKQGEYIASRSPSGDFMREVKPYSFKKMKLFIDDQGRVDPGTPGNIEVFVLQKNDPDEYRNSLESILRKMFGGF
jgi:hypothetical protein